MNDGKIFYIERRMYLGKIFTYKPKAIQNSILNLKSAFDSLCLDEKEQAINKSRHNFKLFGGQ